jgi:hypothetical protein
MKYDELFLKFPRDNWLHMVLDLRLEHFMMMQLMVLLAMVVLNILGLDHNILLG